MARNRFCLSCALRHVFFNDFGLDRTFIMSDLAALFLYYADNDVLPQLSADYNRLNVWLTKVELIRKPRKEESYPMPKDYHVDLNNEEEIRSFKFAPQINMPQVPVYKIDSDTADQLAEELSAIDVASLAAYVRGKAIAAGDLILGHIEDDDQTW
ncbi:hypothetical protein [Ruminococcus albus]|uniref:Uncharacterized protein n=1 Tax=Ruminococcus albus TaxID=1264 RepID=A0A1I1ETL0_RUMAL|nr:hypothetical protein [Ruminococcus albus]SFB90022.1 hypothetical protein SAMN02910406_00801 [Ruminococcus albus]